MNTTKCSRCNGSGHEPDPRLIGKAMRQMRLKAKIRLRRMAELLDLSPAYVCRLEQGRRAWKRDMIEDFTKACKTKKPVKEITYGK